LKYVFLMNSSPDEEAEAANHNTEEDTVSRGSSSRAEEEEENNPSREDDDEDHLVEEEEDLVDLDESHSDGELSNLAARGAAVEEGEERRPLMYTPARNQAGLAKTRVFWFF
jgi:hypothetical protein